MLICGDALTELKKLDSGIVQTCITSPPYWGLRDYGCEGQLGLESTPEEYVATLVAIFAEVKRVLREDGTLWLVIGDSYSAKNGSGGRKKRFGCNHYGYGKFCHRCKDIEAGRLVERDGKLVAVKSGKRKGASDEC